MGGTAWWGRVTVMLTFNGCPIMWGLLESRHHGVTMAQCCPTIDQDPRRFAVGCACGFA